MVVAVLVFDLDAGPAVITLAVLLSTAWPEYSHRAVVEIARPPSSSSVASSPTVGALDEMGTITWAGEGVGGVPLLPLAVPFLERSAIGMIAAPDVDRERFFRQLMVYGGIVVAVVPAAAWLVMVVPGWG